jgi:ATP adenylyltransferase
MLLAPRSKSDYTFADGTSLSLNALAFAGMVMTKQKEQLKHVEEFGVRKILLDVGYPRAEVANACQSEQQLDN